MPKTAKKDAKRTTITPAPQQVAVIERRPETVAADIAADVASRVEGERVIHNELERPGEVEADSPLAQIASVLEQLGSTDSDSFVQVWRLDRQDPRQKSYVCQMLPSEFTMQRLTDDCGGGLFELLVYGPRFREESDGVGGTVQRKIGVSCFKRQRINIEGAPKTPRRAEAEPVAEKQSEIAVLAKAMVDGQAAILQALQNRPGEKSLLESLREMAEIRTLLGGSEKQQDPFALVERVLSIQEKVRDSMPSGDGGGMGELIGLGKMVMSGVNKLPAPVPGSGGDAVNAAQPVNDSEPDEEEAAVNLMYAAKVTQLVGLAKKGAVAVEVAKDLFEEYGDELAPILALPNWLQVLAQFNKNVVTHQAWFVQVHSEMSKLYSEARKQNSGSAAS